MAEVAQVENGYTTQQASIAAGAGGLSGEVPLYGRRLIGIFLPAAGWQAANLTFQLAERSELEGGVFRDVYNDAGAEVVVTAGGNRYVIVSTPLLRGPVLKIRSGTVGSPVNQTGAPTLVLVLSALGT